MTTWIVVATVVLIILVLSRSHAGSTRLTGDPDVPLMEEESETL